MKASQKLFKLSYLVCYEAWVGRSFLKKWTWRWSLKCELEEWEGNVYYQAKRRVCAKVWRQDKSTGPYRNRKLRARQSQKGQRRGSQSAIPGLAASAAWRYLLKGKFSGLTPGLSNQKVGWDFILRLMKTNWGFKQRANVTRILVAK